MNPFSRELFQAFSLERHLARGLLGKGIKALDKATYA